MDTASFHENILESILVFIVPWNTSHTAKNQGKTTKHQQQHLLLFQLFANEQCLVYNLEDPLWISIWASAYISQ